MAYMTPKNQMHAIAQRVRSGTKLKNSQNTQKNSRECLNVYNIHKYSSAQCNEKVSKENCYNSFNNYDNFNNFFLGQHYVLPLLPLIKLLKFFNSSFVSPTFVLPPSSREGFGTAEKILLLSFISAVILMAILGNLLVMVAVCRDRQLR